MVKNWKQASIKNIAKIAGVGTASVDRVLHNRQGVSKKIKDKVLKAYNEILSNKQDSPLRKIVVCCESGSSFNNTLKKNIEKFLKTKKINIILEPYFISAKNFKTTIFEKIIYDKIKDSDGLIIVSQEDSKIERAIQKYIESKKPVIALTTDLPNSNRSAYVGCDQSAAGATAAKLIADTSNSKTGKILMVMSMPYRCQQERELGFKKILRSNFPKLTIKESIYSLDTSEESYKHVKQYIKNNGPPIGIYSIAGGNVGVAEAVRDTGYKNQIIFIGHELNKNSKQLLDTEEMSYVIGHDINLEVEKSFSIIEDFYNEAPINNFQTNTFIYTKHNCIDYELIF